MTDNEAFETLEVYAAKYETDVNTYLVDRASSENIESQGESQIKSTGKSPRSLAIHSGATPKRKRFDDIFIFKEPESEFEWPRISLWDYMRKTDVIDLLKLERKRDVKKQIDENMESTHPKGIPRIICRELMYSVTKFCKRMNFNVEQSGHVLSNFYFTHKFFTGTLERTPDKVYLYFKDFLLCHCLPYPPDSIKLFTHQDAKQIMEYFSNIYLRNLPLIRFLCLPNFALYLDYTIEPDIAPVRRKGKTDKKGKKGKKGKGKKK